MFVTLRLPPKYPFDIEEGTKISIEPCISNPDIYAGILAGVEIGIIEEDLELKGKTRGIIRKRISQTIYEMEI